MALVYFSTAHQRFTCVRLPDPHLTEFLPAFSRSVHHLGSYPHAAPGGLRTGPATRPRGTHPHLPCSMASVSRSVRPPSSAFVAHFRGARAKIGIDLPESTVAKYMVRRRKPPSATWRAFLKNHVREIVDGPADRRGVPVGRHPLRDPGGVHGTKSRKRVASLGMEEVLIAPQSRWQNTFVEQLISGTDGRTSRCSWAEHRSRGDFTPVPRSAQRTTTSRRCPTCPPCPALMK